ncbi:beta-glucosidase [Ruminococcaceae bacterium YRB3002]|nr:beta-glucosidase [Ruminococcaceae bacterium YRB3002]
MKNRVLSGILVVGMMASFVMPVIGCTPAVEETEPSWTGATSGSSSEENTKWTPDMTPEEILATLTLEQKASQMVQSQVRSCSHVDMEEGDYGSMFSTKDEWPAISMDNWISRVRIYQEHALASEAGIPYIYGQDSVHGVNTADAAILYPHNINIGAANDPELTYEYGRLVGSDMKRTGMIWNFGPVVTDPQDPRWGRTYECFSSDLDRLTPLALAYVKGQLDEGVISCPKHFFAEGHVAYGTGEYSDGTNRLIDRGNTSGLTDDELNALLNVYKQLIDAGAQTVMISHAALEGVKMHENGKYIMKLKDDFGFSGFIVSDYNSLHNCSGDTLYENVVLAINAGIDMLMEPDDYETVRDIIVDAVGKGDITEARVDDAVLRILKVKKDVGLFDDPYLENTNPSYDWYSDYGKEVARKLACESFVPLKVGSNMTIPKGARVFVCGPAANDTGVLCGGWTITWTGYSDTEEGVEWVMYARTIQEALQDVADEEGFTIVTDPEEASTCDMVLLCLGEIPYAEWTGDTEDLSITGSLAQSGNQSAIEFAMSTGLPTTTLLVCGRNVIIDEYIDQWDSVIMCYLPGTEGGRAVAEVLTGKSECGGTLPMPYYSSVDQIGTGECWHDVGWRAA